MNMIISFSISPTCYMLQLFVMLHAMANIVIIIVITVNWYHTTSAN